MLQSLHPAIRDDLTDSPSADITVTITPAALLDAQIVGQAELERRSQSAAARPFAGPLQQLASPRTSVFMAAVVVAVLLLQRTRPDMLPPSAMWLLSWAPFLLFTALWWAACPTLRQVSARSFRRRLFPILRPGAPDVETQLRVLPGEVVAACANRRLHVLHDARHTTVETPDAFTMVLDDAVVPIPKHGLDGAAVASLRAVLRRWQLRDAPPRPSLVLPLLAAILLVGGLWLQAEAARAAQPGGSVAATARRTPGQATIRLTDRSMRLDGWRTSIEKEDYLVWMVDGQMYDQLRGTIRHRAAEGRFWLGRHGPGNTARTPEAERRNLQDSTSGVEPAPDDAAMTALPDSGVLITWPSKRDEGSCAALRSYRDQIPAEALPAGVTSPHYRRNLLLRFCARAMSPSELGDWLTAAIPAFYAEFNAAVRP